LSAFDIIGSKVHNNTIILSQKLRHQSSLVPYSTDSHSNPAMDYHPIQKQSRKLTLPIASWYENHGYMTDWN